MDRDQLKELLEALSKGTLAPAEAYEQLQNLPYYVELGFAKVDCHRALRQGMPEVIFCPGKTPEQIVKIAQTLKAHHKVVLATRCTPEQAEAITSILPEVVYEPCARTIIWGEPPAPADSSPLVAVLSAGTADLPVAEEAAFLLSSAGIRVERLYDVGVAGLQRLLAHVDCLRHAAVVIVVAGMDGALPSVVGGLIECPVIAVPTSVGYGASFQGVAALLSMLNSCAAGVSVVNIDNGFGAAMAAVRVLSRVEVGQNLIL